MQRGTTSFYDFSQDGDGTRVMPGTDTGTPGSDNQDGSSVKAPVQPSVATPSFRPYAEQEQFKGSNYAELENFIRSQMKDVKVETPEERRKREKREKWEGVISGISDMGMALSNLFFTTQYAPNMYDGKNSLSLKAKERFEKAKAERERNQDRFMNYALTLGKIKDADRDFNFRLAQADRQQANWQAQFDAGRADAAQQQQNWQTTFDANRADRKNDEEFRDKKFEYEQQRDERNFNESVRQFNVSSSIQRQGLAIQAQRLQLERENNSQTYTLGEGQGSVTVPRSAINSHNFSVVYNSLPAKYRTAQGDPIMTKDALGNTVISGYGAPSAEAMAIAVGAFLGDQSIPADKKVATRTALSQIGTKKGGDNKTMPGVN